MAQGKYALPAFLVGRCTAGVYRRWLQRRAAAHRKRDRVRGNLGATISAYKEAIHTAVLRGGEREGDDVAGSQPSSGGSEEVNYPPSDDLGLAGAGARDEL